MTEVELWIEPVPGLSAIALGSILVILFSGVYLTIQKSGFGLAWIGVTMGAFLLMAPLGAVTGKRLAYFGFGTTLISASIAHLARGDARLSVFFPIDPLLFLGILIVSYFYFEKSQSISSAAKP